MEFEREILPLIIIFTVVRILKISLNQNKITCSTETLLKIVFKYSWTANIKIFLYFYHIIRDEFFFKDTSLVIKREKKKTYNKQIGFQFYYFI